MKWLYAHAYYTEDEFWSMFDRKWYDNLREKYGATALTNVFEKVTVDVEGEKRKERELNWAKRLLRKWPLAGFYGIKKAIESKAYLAARASKWKTMEIGPSRTTSDE